MKMVEAVMMQKEILIATVLYDLIHDTYIAGSC